MSQDRPKAVPKEMISNDRFKVTEWRFAPGAETGWHRHQHDYVIVPMTTGRLLLEEQVGKSLRRSCARGEPYFRQVGVEHNVINANEREFVFIEIEAIP